VPVTDTASLDTGVPAQRQRTPAKRKARELAKHLRGERPDYTYVKEVFRHLRAELDIEVTTTVKKLPFVPTEQQLRAFYEQVWRARRGGDIVLVKTLLYTGVRVAELVRVRLDDVDLDACRLRITDGKGGKDRYVPFPTSFREALALHIDARRRAGARSCSSRPRRSATPTAACARSSPGTAPQPGSSSRSARTSCGTSCSPGSRPRASTTRTSSRTPGTPPASRWRSTPGCPWRPPRPATTP
jgi:integrase